MTRFSALYAVGLLIFAGHARAAEDCHPVSPAEIEQMWARDATVSDAEPMPGSDQFQCVRVDAKLKIVCRTKPGHYAHPTIVYRTLHQKDGTWYVKMEADTAADCPSFYRLMDEYKELNAKMRDSLRGNQ